MRRAIDRFAPGIVVGLIAGIALGWVVWGMKPAPEKPAGPPPVMAADLPVHLGQVTDKPGRTVFALTLTNKAGRRLAGVRATCRFFDVGDRVIGVGAKDWGPQEPGATASGEITVAGVTWAGIDHFQCRGAPIG